MKHTRWLILVALLLSLTLALCACGEPIERRRNDDSQTMPTGAPDDGTSGAPDDSAGDEGDETPDVCTHSFGEWVQIKAPTCTEDGEETRTCSVCGESEGRSIDATGHSLGEWMETTPATCTWVGQETRTCTNCTYFEQRAIDTIAHDYQGNVEGITCSACGDEIQASEGLSYTLLENDTYMVSGIGTCEDETIIIPAIYNGKTITVIGEQAFMDCSDIIGVYIYAPITEIQYCAFSGCAGLRTIKIPATVTKLFEGAFSACENLDSVYLDDFAKWCEIEYCCPDGYWYESGVPDASPLPFAKRLYIDNVYTNHLVIPEGITTIDKEMFSGCSFLSAITIPSTVNYMSFDAFSGCNKLKDVYITDLEKWFEIQFSPYSWSNSECESNPLFNDGRLYLNGELVEHLEIPSSVTSIPSKVFNGCQSIKSVFIHKGVEEIGVNSFMRCSNLESVVFEEGGCLTNIDIYAFDGCYNLSEFNIPPTVTAIHEHAFDGCGELRFELPESLTYLGVGALPYDMYETYEGCNYVGNWLVSGYSGSNSSVTIKEGTVGIAEKAFGGYDSSFTSVTIPSSVKYICREAFSELQTLENVVFEEGSTLHAISPYAFQNCINLKNVALPESITEIGYSVFSGCISLETITLPKSVESIGSNSFYGCDALVAIYWETEYDWVGRRWADDVIYFGKEELWDEDALADYMTNLFCEYSWEKS